MIIFKLFKIIMFIVVFALCYLADVDGQEGGRARAGGWAGYAEAPGLRGWLGLRRDPRDWSAAAADCLNEEAALASPWSPEFSSALGALAARSGLPILYSGARATLPFLAASSRLWPGYEYSAALRGWLKLHNTPRDWPQARVTCHLEGAFLSAAWSPEFRSAGRAPRHAVHAGVRARQDYADAAYSYVNGAPVLSLEPAALVRREACLTLHANGSESQVSCEECLLFVCYAPLPTAPAATPTSPSDLDAGPSPGLLPLRPTEHVTFRTLRTVRTASSSPITNPTTTTSPVPITTAAAPTSTAVSTTSTTTLAPTTRPTPVPTSTAVPTPSTTPVPTTPSSTPTAAALSNVCEEMGLAEYRWEAETEQCYRFHARGAAWPEANETCVREGAALAVANSHEEARLFTRLLLQHLKSGIRDAKFKGAFALGFYWDQEWKTVDGRPLEDAGYAKWWPGWPRDSERAPWGYMEHTGRLENYPTTITTPFICEAV